VALSTGGGRRVLSLGSFSKLLAPSLRCGFVLAHPETLQAAYLASGVVCSGGGVNPLSALVVAELAGSGELAAHHALLCAALGRRMQALLDALAALGVASAERGGGPVLRPAGGYFCWVPLGRGGSSGRLIDTASTEFKQRCDEHKLMVTPGLRCLVGAGAVPLGLCDDANRLAAERCADRARNAVRLCVAHTPEPLIREAAKALASVVRLL
jgi:DNA-binding transcriptional MocR family regulator